MEVPLDRDCGFEPVLVEKRQRDTSKIEQHVIAPYAKGVDTREIQDHPNQLCGIEVSPALISDITDRTAPMILVQNTTDMFQ